MSAPSLHEMSAKAQAICLEYYQAGLEETDEAKYREAYMDGWAACRDWMDRAAAATGWANFLLPSYTELCVRRGEIDRAQRNATLLRKRGLL